MCVASFSWQTSLAWCLLLTQPATSYYNVQCTVQFVASETLLTCEETIYPGIFPLGQPAAEDEPGVSSLLVLTSSDPIKNYSGNSAPSPRCCVLCRTFAVESPATNAKSNIYPPTKQRATCIIYSHSIHVGSSFATEEASTTSRSVVATGRRP